MVWGKKKIYIFFFWKSFNLWRPLLMIALYHQTKKPICFWCKRGLNPRWKLRKGTTLRKGISTYFSWLIERMLITKCLFFFTSRRNEPNNNITLLLHYEKCKVKIKRIFFVKLLIMLLFSPTISFMTTKKKSPNSMSYTNKPNSPMHFTTY